MQNGMKDHTQPIFNEIRIDLRSQNTRFSTDNDHRSHSTVPSRASRYSEYPQVRPTNPFYINRSTATTFSSNVRSSATLVNRRQKFDPQAPRRPKDWRWLAILCIILFFPLGLFAFAFARKAQNKFRDGFINQAHRLNQWAFIFSILSILSGIALILALLFGFDAWPRTNG